MHKALGLATLLLVVNLGGCTGLDSSSARIKVPDKLQPAANESMAIVVPAKGVQIYECRAKKDQSDNYEWAFVGPEADLFDLRGNRIGRHYAGPHWESTDRSTIVGTLKERADAPLADAIPWLLLGAKSIGSDGAFSKVTSIQRVNTVGGVAPRIDCSQAAVGAHARVQYAADYYFFTDR
ncbi:MAG: DUF3455 domain-containing protein [Burkholderiales bacterium]